MRSNGPRHASIVNTVPFSLPAPTWIVLPHHQINDTFCYLLIHPARCPGFPGCLGIPDPGKTSRKYGSYIFSSYYARIAPPEIQNRHMTDHRRETSVTSRLDFPFLRRRSSRHFPALVRTCPRRTMHTGVHG